MLFVILILSAIQIAQTRLLVSEEVYDTGPMYELHCKYYHKDRLPHDHVKSKLTQRTQAQNNTYSKNPLIKKLFHPVDKISINTTLNSNATYDNSVDNNNTPFNPLLVVPNPINIEDIHSKNDKHNDKNNTEFFTTTENSKNIHSPHDTIYYGVSTPKMRVYQNYGSKFLKYLPIHNSRISSAIPFDLTNIGLESGINLNDEMNNTPYGSINNDDYINSVNNPGTGAQFITDIFQERISTPFDSTKYFENSYIKQLKNKPDAEIDGETIKKNSEKIGDEFYQKGHKIVTKPRKHKRLSHKGRKQSKTLKSLNPKNVQEIGNKNSKLNGEIYYIPLEDSKGVRPTRRASKSSSDGSKVLTQNFTSNRNRNSNGKYEKKQVVQAQNYGNQYYTYDRSNDIDNFIMDDEPISNYLDVSNLHNRQMDYDELDVPTYHVIMKPSTKMHIQNPQFKRRNYYPATKMTRLGRTLKTKPKTIEVNSNRSYLVFKNFE